VAHLHEVGFLALSFYKKRAGAPRSV